MKLAVPLAYFFLVLLPLVILLSYPVAGLSVLRTASVRLCFVAISAGIFVMAVAASLRRLNRNGRPS